MDLNDANEIASTFVRSSFATGKSKAWNRLRCRNARTVFADGDIGKFGSGHPFTVNARLKSYTFTEWPGVRPATHK